MHRERGNRRLPAESGDLVISYFGAGFAAGAAGGELAGGAAGGFVVPNRSTALISNVFETKEIASFGEALWGLISFHNVFAPLLENEPNQRPTYSRLISTPPVGESR